MKLLKLIYFAHGWHLAIKGEPLINESIEAWKFGPVVPTVYHKFKEFGTSPITRKAREYQFTSIGMAGFREVEPRLPIDPSLELFLQKIWEVYSGFTAGQLSELTHQENTPWHNTWFRLGAQHIRGMDISNTLMKEYFQTKVKKGTETAHG